MSRRNTFYLWLMEQSKRDDPVGDLARDVAVDSTAPQYAFRFKTWRSHLQAKRASKEAIEALQMAFDEFVKR